MMIDVDNKLFATFFCLQIAQYTRSPERVCDRSARVGQGQLPLHSGSFLVTLYEQYWTQFTLATRSRTCRL